jgi:hypothetical protein
MYLDSVPVDSFLLLEQRLANIRHPYSVPAATRDTFGLARDLMCGLLPFVWVNAVLVVRLWWNFGRVRLHEKGEREDLREKDDKEGLIEKVKA